MSLTRTCKLWKTVPALKSCFPLLCVIQLLKSVGVLSLVTIIPAVLFTVAIFVIGKYELSDERMDEINMEIAKRR